MKKLMNKKGSALVWALIVVSVLFITVAGIVTVCSVYHQSAVSSMKETKLRYIARSAVDLVANEIENGNSDFIPPSGSSVSSILYFDEMDCNVVVVRNSGKIRIHATVNEVLDRFTLGGILEKKQGEWKFASYADI